MKGEMVINRNTINGIKRQMKINLAIEMVSFYTSISLTVAYNDGAFAFTCVCFPLFPPGKQVCGFEV